MIGEAIIIPTLQLMGLPQSGIHIASMTLELGCIIHIANHRNLSWMGLSSFEVLSLL